jgi:hypothetical protein
MTSGTGRKALDERNGDVTTVTDWYPALAIDARQLGY